MKALFLIHSPLSVGVVVRLFVGDMYKISDKISNRRRPFKTSFSQRNYAQMSRETLSWNMKSEGDPSMST